MRIEQNVDLIIDALIKKHELSFRQIQEYYKTHPENPFENPNPLTRALHYLKKQHFIDEDTSNPTAKVKKRYKLSDVYYKQITQKTFTTHVEKSINAGLLWRTIYSSLYGYIDMNYPNLSRRKNPVIFYALLSDAISYLHVIGYTRDDISTYKEVIYDLILYFLRNHPDKKYKTLLHEIHLNLLRKKYPLFMQLVNQTIEDKHIVEFPIISHPSEANSTSDVNPPEKAYFYVLYDDPLLYKIRQEIEISFTHKFLFLWRFSSINLSDHFDFFLQYTNAIINTLQSSNENNPAINDFINQFRLSLLIHAQEHLLRMLNQNDVEFPFELLSPEKKQQYLGLLISEPRIWTENDIANLKLVLESKLGDETEEFYQIEEYIEEVNAKIDQSTKIAIDNLIYRSHLLHLLRIFYQINRTAYIKYTRKFGSLKGIEFTYDNISDTIYRDLQSNAQLMLKNQDYIYKSFIRRHLLERMDHLVNTYLQSPKKFEQLRIKMHDLIQFALTIFPDRHFHPFDKKMCQIFLQFVNKPLNFFTNQEIFSSFSRIVQFYPQNSDLLYLYFEIITKMDDPSTLLELFTKFTCAERDYIEIIREFKDKIPKGLNITELSSKAELKITEPQTSEFYVFGSVFLRLFDLNLIPNSNDQFIFRDESIHTLYQTDIRLYSRFETESLSILNFQIILVNKYFGARWAINYCQNYIEYCCWYFTRIILPEKKSVILDINQTTLINCLEFTKNVLLSKIYWDDHDRFQCSVFYLNASKILNRIDFKSPNSDPMRKMMQIILELFNQIDVNLS